MNIRKLMDTTLDSIQYQSLLSDIQTVVLYAPTGNPKPNDTNPKLHLFYRLFLCT